MNLQLKPLFRLPALAWLLWLLIPLLLLLTKCSPSPEPLPTPAVVARDSPQVIEEKKVEVPLITPKKTVKAYKHGIKNTIPLPPEVLGDSSKYVTSSVVVTRAEHGQTATSVLDVSTGETTTYVAPLPTPLFSFVHKGELSVDYGYKQGTPFPVGRVNVREDILQIKSVHFGVSATGYTDGDYFVGVGGSYKW